MNQELGLQILADLLEWPDNRAREEYRWLRVMSYLKYDGYQDFIAGKRFIESAIHWLNQFRTPAERAIAYAFIRQRLVYLGPAEMQHLVRLTYPEHVRRPLLRTAAAECGIAAHEVWQSREARTTFDRLRRSTLFVGLSDGARIDVFRRANVGVLSNEQVVAMAQFDETKWSELVKDLRDELGEPDARFRYVVLLDDFAASGRSLLRWDDVKQVWKGKLARFHRNVTEYAQDALAADWGLLVHHYVAGHEGREWVIETEQARRGDSGAGPWFPAVGFSFSTVLPPWLKLDPTHDGEFLRLVDDYYDSAIETRHTDIGGQGAKLGFAGCALPVVLDHNTPNNSVALLWAESDGNQGHAMRPLFRRRQRHN